MGFQGHEKKKKKKIDAVVKNNRDQMNRCPIFYRDIFTNKFDGKIF
jgi:hypothetical protein